MKTELTECKCTMKQSSLGDGCIYCNTEYCIDCLPTPEELCAELQDVMTDDQAYQIASDVYQPLITLIKVLNDKINKLNKVS